MKEKKVIFSLVVLTLLSSCSDAPISSFLIVSKNLDALHKQCLSHIEKGNYSKALKFCREACKLNARDACFRQAYILDRYTQGNAKEAVELYSKLCDDGHGEACFNLGGIYESGRTGVEKDIKVARDYYKKGCELGLSLACKKFDSLSLTMPAPSYSDELDGTKIVETTYDEGSIKDLVETYFKAVEEKRIDDALDMYVSYRKPYIKVDKLSAIANDTEYYVVEHVDIVQRTGNTAQVYVRVRHKKYSARKEEVWEGVWTLEKERGQWKIVRTPGRRIM